MKSKSITTLLFAAGVMAAPALYASTVTLTEVGGNANGGGLFQAVTSNNGTFDTFCLSIATEFSPGTPYSYTISSKINANTPPVGAPTYITEGTAYIYSQFLKGNSDFAGVGNANNVQAAIWYLQGLLSNTQNPANPNEGTGYGVTGQYIDPENGANLQSGVQTILSEVELQTGLTEAELRANGNGIYNVGAMDISNSDGSNAQPQLALLPEPGTIFAGAMLLAPLGISAFRKLRRPNISV